MLDEFSTRRLHDSLILIVDDIELNRKMLSHSLGARGYTNFALAEDGAQALKMTYELKPDLVILDLMMPAMDGFSYCQAVRQNPAYDNMPIIVQTALDEIEQKLRAFELGASDYICKPIDPGELTARTQVHLSQKILREDLTVYRKKITAELESARLMQSRIMPGTHQIEMCQRVYDMDIASHFETSSELGGDCWGMRPLSDQRLAVYMFDFSGHGITAAMNVFRMHTIMQEFIHASGEPGSFLTTLNRHLYPLLERDEFATMFYGIIDTDANCLLYSTAATSPALLFARSEPSPISLSGRGFPLGVVPNATYETKYTPFVQGDMLLLYSDCVIETPNLQGEFLTEQILTEIVAKSIKNAPLAGQAAVSAVLSALRNHSANQMLDDVTINAYARTRKGGSHPS